MRPDGLWLPRLLCPGNSPGKNTGVGCQSRPLGIFLTQGLNGALLHCRQTLHCPRYQGNYNRKLPTVSISPPALCLAIGRAFEAEAQLQPICRTEVTSLGQALGAPAQTSLTQERNTFFWSRHRTKSSNTLEPHWDTATSWAQARWYLNTLQLLLSRFSRVRLWATP